MKKISLFVSIFVIILVMTGCIFTTELRVYYEKGSAKNGSVPVDSKTYNYGDTVIILGKGDLSNEDYEFIGWQYDGLIYRPGDTLSHYYDEDIRFTAIWDDGIGAPFEFRIVDDEAIVSKYTGNSHSNIAIPSNYLRKPVTQIDNNVFRNVYIYSVTLSKNLKNIGAFTFSGCYLSSITIPDSVISIGTAAFQDNDLFEINFGSGLSSIAQGAFSNNELQTVILPDNIKTIGKGAFFGNRIDRIIIGADVSIEDDDSFGTFGASFKSVYYNAGKQAGEYGYTAGTWVLVP